MKTKKLIMAKILTISIAFFCISCSEKKATENNNDKTEEIKQDSIIISEQEKKLQIFEDSIKIYIIRPSDSLEIEYTENQHENYKIQNISIEILKKDNIDISWLKINSHKIPLKKLKTINPRVDGRYEDMFCQSIEKIKLYEFENDKIIFLQFTYHPCTGLGCSVSDYLIYSVNTNQTNLFGSFRSADLDLYSFPFNKKLNYIATEYKGDFHGATPIQYISRIYSMDSNGKFQLTKDKKGNEYYFEIKTSPKDTFKQIEFQSNWF